MFFIFGSPRSGTTLLAQCLSCHSQIVVPNETDFIIPLAFVFDRIREAEIGREMLFQFITRSWTYHVSLGEYVEPSRVREIIYASAYQPAEILIAIYADVARKAGVPLAGDKSPNDLQYVRKLIKVQGISAEMKIIHIVRDIRDVMVSLKRTGWLPDGDAYFPRLWCNSNLYLYGLYRDRPQQYYFLRYEDFTRAPEKHLNDICRLLGVSFEPAMMDHQRRHTRYRENPGHAKVLQPITTDSIGRYSSELAPELIGAFQRQAGEALDVFGYKRYDAAAGKSGILPWRIHFPWSRLKCG
ncbi:MAG: sulfotransferase [Thermoguttaceae bacterium]|jgi:hypothetical protein